ncbi:hypothetical protein [Bradyrhizobium symbiodeficiens]|uniref:hypothetical protein n=1 Tax=Bradyrhizobium symbiodeficiens TaxID=1404367 RepID=UPI0012D735DF|nr:hypothetical protein [Bradyrhizobium symbiodeficiens]
MDIKNEKSRLSDALKQNSEQKWAAAALSVTDDPRVVFAGSAGGASSKAGDLLRIYQIRQKHCVEEGIETYGMAELIDVLSDFGERGLIQVQPFLGPGGSIAAFWDAAGDLLGCITVLGRDSESGWGNLDFANGKI